MTDAVEMPSDPATRLRNELADKLVTDGMITDPMVEHAFRTIPRHMFVPPGTPLEEAYADDAVRTKWDERGTAISSVSAPFIQARMIEQARVRPGMRVLEIGSGGYNAALLAEVVGPQGHVVTVDIDPEVTGRALTGLKDTGYGDRVTVVLADAEYGVPGERPFDAIIVTAGAWDIAPAWLAQLTENGYLVVPLLMNGVTRSIGFRREEDHLVSSSAEVCGFVPMQGAGVHPERTVQLTDNHGQTVTLRFDHVPDHLDRLHDVLKTGHREVWSGVTFPNRTSFADLYLWFACFLPGFCRLSVAHDSELAVERGRWFPFGTVHRAGLAYLVIRPAMDGAGVEFGARGYGPDGLAAANAMTEQIQAWDAQARGRPEPTFAYWPTGCSHQRPAEGTAVLPKTHGLLTISWPVAS